MRLQQSAFASFAPLASHLLFDAQSDYPLNSWQKTRSKLTRGPKSDALGWNVRVNLPSGTAGGINKGRRATARCSTAAQPEVSRCPHFRLNSVLSVFPPQLWTNPDTKERPPAPHRGTHAASGRRVPCGSPLMLGRTGPRFTHLAVGFSSSRVGGGFALNSYSTLGQLGSHFCLSFSFYEQKIKSKKKTLEFLRFKNPVLG